MNIKQMFWAFILSGLSFFAAQGSEEPPTAYQFVHNIKLNIQARTDEPTFNMYLNELRSQLETTDIDIDKMYDRTGYFNMQFRESIRSCYEIFKKLTPVNSDTIKQRCAAVEEVFEKAGKPLVSPTSTKPDSKHRGAQSKTDQPSSEEYWFPRSNRPLKRALILITGCATLIIGGIALTVALSNKKKARTTGN